VGAQDNNGCLYGLALRRTRQRNSLEIAEEKAAEAKGVKAEAAEAEAAEATATEPESVESEAEEPCRLTLPAGDAAACSLLVGQAMAP
jgi:hypothetical protein